MKLPGKQHRAFTEGSGNKKQMQGIVLLRHFLEFILWLKEELIADEFVSRAVFCIVRALTAQEFVLTAALPALRILIRQFSESYNNICHIPSFANIN